MKLGQIEIRFCKECGEPFNLTHHGREFCGPSHKTQYHNRRIKCGMQLYELVMRWRIDRVKGALSELGSLADIFAADERERRTKRKARIEAFRKSRGLPPEPEPPAEEPSGDPETLEALGK